MREPASRILQIAIATGLVGGFAIGLVASLTGSDTLLWFSEQIRPLGTLFLNAIKMVVIPLVVVVIFDGIANLGNAAKLGRLGLFTIGFFWISVFPAILIGMGVMYIGLGFAVDIAMPEVSAQSVPELPGFVDFFLGLVPANPFESAANGSLLPLLVFTALVAAAVTTLPSRQKKALTAVSGALSSALIRLVNWILWIAPFGIFALSASSTAVLGWDLVNNLLVFIVAVFIGLTVFIAVVYFPLIRFYSRRSTLSFVRDSFGGTAVAFSATSTVAALPVMLEESREKLKVSESVSDLVLPLGASMYRAGSALFQGAAIVFLAHIFAIQLPPGAWGGAILSTFLVSLTVAPVPSSGVMTLTPALETLGIPISGLGVLLGIDRIPDMFRSATNALGQQTVNVLAEKWMNQKQTSDKN